MRGVDLQLNLLHEMHPLSSQTTAREYAHRAAVGLARHGHVSGVRLEAHFDGQDESHSLRWRDKQEDGDTHLDFNRVTEDAAEAIALALVHAVKG